MMLRTYRSDGAEENQMNGQFYEHAAPMERVVSGWDHDATNIPLRWSGLFLVGPIVATNIPLRWSGGKSDEWSILRTYRSDGAARLWLGS